MRKRAAIIEGRSQYCAVAGTNYLVTNWRLMLCALVLAVACARYGRYVDFGIAQFAALTLPIWALQWHRGRTEKADLFSLRESEKRFKPIVNPIIFTILCSVALAVSSPMPVWAQDLSPRAYVITPLHSNAIVLTYSFFDGGIQLDGAAPISNATGRYNVSVLSYYHAFGFFGRSANVNASFPYAVGNFKANVAGVPEQIYRSGLLDFAARVSVNLRGGRAMPIEEMRTWKQKTLLGVSLKLVAPSGQYDPTHLVNWGTNRWALKPEFGYSRRRRNLLLDGYAGVWFYTANPRAFSLPVPKRQTQEPIGSFEGHLSYDLKPRFWFSLDGNFWFGGITSLSGIANPATRQTSSRIGATASFPLTKAQSVKVSYNEGAYVRFGGNYQSISVAWQYSWLGRPK